MCACWEARQKFQTGCGQDETSSRPPRPGTSEEPPGEWVAGFHIQEGRGPLWTPSPERRLPPAGPQQRCETTDRLPSRPLRGPLRRMPGGPLLATTGPGARLRKDCRVEGEAAVDRLHSDRPEGHGRRGQPGVCRCFCSAWPLVLDKRSFRRLYCRAKTRSFRRVTPHGWRRPTPLLVIVEAGMARSMVRGTQTDLPPWVGRTW